MSYEREAVGPLEPYDGVDKSVQVRLCLLYLFWVPGLIRGGEFVVEASLCLPDEMVIFLTSEIVTVVVDVLGTIVYLLFSVGGPCYQFCAGSSERIDEAFDLSSDFSLGFQELCV